MHNAASTCEIDPEDCYFLPDIEGVFCVTVDSIRHAKGLALFVGGEYRHSPTRVGHYEVFNRNYPKDASPRL